MTAQLRIYNIKPGRMDEFAQMVDEHVIPPRLQYGFDVLGKWTVPDNNQIRMDRLLQRTAVLGRGS